MGALGGVAVSYERGTPVQVRSRSDPPKRRDSQLKTDVATSRTLHPEPCTQNAHPSTPTLQPNITGRCQHCVQMPVLTGVPLS